MTPPLPRAASAVPRLLALAALVAAAPLAAQSASSVLAGERALAMAGTSRPAHGARAGNARDHRVARAPHALDTLALAHLALRRGQLELVPALERMSTASGDAIVARPMLAGAAAELRHARARAGVAQLLDRTAASLDAMCADAREQRRRSCRAMAIDLAVARAHVKAGRKVEARRALASLAQRADAAARRGELEPWEGTVLGETARYAIARV